MKLHARTTARPYFRIVSVALFAFAAALALSPGAYAQLTVYPANPAAGSMIRIDGVSGCFGLPVEIAVQGFPNSAGGAVIKVFDPIWLDLPLMPCPPGNKNHVVYGPVSAGTYRLEHYLRLSPPTPDHLLGASTFTVAGGNNTRASIRWFGNWWAPSQPGWAVNLERDPATGNIFMAWYTHEQQGSEVKPVWVVAPNLAEVPSIGVSAKLSGEIYRAQGNRGLVVPDGSPISPAFSIIAQPVGAVSLEFTAPDGMTLRYTMSVSGGAIAPPSPAPTIVTGTLLLQRFRY